VVIFCVKQFICVRFRLLGLFCVIVYLCMCTFLVLDWGDGGGGHCMASPDRVVSSRMVNVSASVNLPLHHKVQKFSSGTGSRGCGCGAFLLLVLVSSVSK